MFSVFQRSVLLDGTLGDVYAFHEDPRNISKISPPSLKVKRVECLVPARAGEAFRLSLSQFGLPLEWVGVWEEASPHSRLVDGARKSPFKHWRHQHLFTPSGAGTLMTDRVEYSMPFGIAPRGDAGLLCQKGLSSPRISRPPELPAVDGFKAPWRLTWKGSRGYLSRLGTGCDADLCQILFLTGE